MNLQEGAVSFLEVTIKNGTKVSDVIELDNGVYPVGFFHPAIDTSTVINFNAKYSETDTLKPINSGGTAKAITIDNTVEAYEPLVPANWVGVRWLQLAVADNQVGDKVFHLAVRGV